MTAEIDGITRIGPWIVAAVAERSVRNGPVLPFWATCEKRPLAVLIRQGEIVECYRTDGSPIGLEAFEELFPGQCAAFERQARALLKRSK